MYTPEKRSEKPNKWIAYNKNKLANEWQKNNSHSHIRYIQKKKKAWMKLWKKCLLCKIREKMLIAIYKSIALFHSPEYGNEKKNRMKEEEQVVVACSSSSKECIKKNGWTLEKQVTNIRTNITFNRWKAIKTWRNSYTLKDTYTPHFCDFFFLFTLFLFPPHFFCFFPYNSVLHTYIFNTLYKWKCIWVLSCKIRRQWQQP